MTRNFIFQSVYIVHIFTIMILIFNNTLLLYLLITIIYNNDIDIY